MSSSPGVKVGVDLQRYDIPPGTNGRYSSRQLRLPLVV